VSGLRHGTAEVKKQLLLSFSLTLVHSWNTRRHRPSAGGVAQWLGRQSLADGLSLPCTRSMVDR